MRHLLFIILFIPGVLLMNSGCDPYAKLARSKNLADKDSAAFGYYHKQKYESAASLLEEIYPIYRGTPKAERILFALAEAKFHLGEYLLAAHYYKEYYRFHPAGKHYEEAAFKEGYCYYRMSPAYELDQAATEKAIETFQLFLLRFPESQYKEKVEEYIKELNNKLALKAFKQAELYYHIGHYKAAFVTFKNLSTEWFDSPYIEKIYYYWFLSAIELAKNSVDEKKQEREEQAKQIYLKFAVKFPNSELLKKAEKYYDGLQRKL